MHYCPKNQSLSVSDYHLNGLSPCLTDTITSSVVSGIAVLGSVIQLSVYAKYATHTDRYTSLKSKLFKLHVLLHVLLICLPIAKLFATVYKLQDGDFYIYQILRCCVQGKSYVRKVIKARIVNLTACIMHVSLLSESLHLWSLKTIQRHSIVNQDPSHTLLLPRL